MYPSISISTLFPFGIDPAEKHSRGGGPVENADGRLVGVAFQKSVEQSADNIGYVLRRH